jgi:hypothetical protein
VEAETSAEPNPVSTTITTQNRTVSPSTVPTRGADRAIGRLRNRSNTPLWMSSHSAVPSPMVKNMAIWATSPGSSSSR